MKKATSIILLALALVAGLTQCKKNNDTNNTGNEGDKQHITLDAKLGGDAKLDVDAPHVVFQNGDQILVASNGVYVGTLAYNGTNFDGDIEGATDNQPLYFYLMGGTIPEGLTVGSSTSCSMSISDQTESKPVIAFAPSNENFGSTSNFTAKLRNKCALVKFSVTTSSSSATRIKGFKNKVEVSFEGEGSFINSQDGDSEREGIITLPAGSGEHWVILLPQDEMLEGDAGSAFSADGYYSGTVGEVPTIDNNGYLTYGIPVRVSTYVLPEGSLNGRFTINEGGDQVHFSKGNLQYQASTNIWRFAENQYDYVGDATNGNVYDNGVKCNNANISSTYTGWIDLFGWGTSGYNHGATAYQPWATSTTNSHYYAYGSATKNLYDAKSNGSMQGQADWGYNAISNGGNKENSGWRTLTIEEWCYIFNTRTNADSKYGFGNVNGMNGMILLPDTWTLPEGLHFTHGFIESEGLFNTNGYTAEEWVQMESNGAVFFPAAGFRYGTTLENVGRDGSYWSSSQYDNKDAYYPTFDVTIFDPHFHNQRAFGFPVRLAHNAE